MLLYQVRAEVSDADGGAADAQPAVDPVVPLEEGAGEEDGVIVVDLEKKKKKKKLRKVEDETEVVEEDKGKR